MMVFRFVVRVWVWLNSVDYDCVVSVDIVERVVDYMGDGVRVVDVGVVGEWWKEKGEVKMMKVVVR